MFEEAWTFAVSARTPETAPDHGYCWHQSGCNLYYWTSPGSVKGRGRLLFLYVEYRSANGDACYTRMQFENQTALQIFLQSHLPYWPLQALDAAQTRSRPVKKDAPASCAPNDVDLNCATTTPEQWKTSEPAAI